MMKVANVVGARPQFIKAAVISRELRRHSSIAELLVHTGQHYDDNMSRRFFEELGLPSVDYHLGIGSGTHGAQTGRMLEALEKVFLPERPDWVVIYGDTNSTLAGALAAAKLNIPMAHVEAGLRSFNRAMPEEINRKLTDHCADLLLAPTDVAVTNLKAEGIETSKIHLVGDVMYDAALLYGQQAGSRVFRLKELGLHSGDYILATVHRAENTDDPCRLRAIIRGLERVSREIPVVVPVHPRTRTVLQSEQLLTNARSQVRLLEPVGYLDMVLLEKNARLIATDSGGVQKEAFFHRVPCVTLRQETEWPELIELGWNSLVPPRCSRQVCQGLREALASPAPSEPKELPYGDGHAAQRVVSLLTKDMAET